MKILHLTLKKKWFDLIASGEKKFEYREDKPYWQKRLLDGETPKHFDIVRFKNGYRKSSPTFDIECKHISFTGPEWFRPEWFTPKHGEIITGDIIVIHLGKLLNQPIQPTKKSSLSNRYGTKSRNKITKGNCPSIG